MLLRKRWRNWNIDDIMPEGDSVYQLSKRLQWMQHREVTATSIRVPSYATVDFTGMTCDRVWPYGKHLFMEFAAPGHEPQILHTHLKMEGTWSVHRAGERWKSRATPLEWCSGLATPPPRHRTRRLLARPRPRLPRARVRGGDGVSRTGPRGG